MKTDKKKAQIKKLAIQLLKESFEKAKKQVDRAINCGAIDIDAWSTDSSPMLVPRAIVTAILLDESTQYNARGTSFEKQMKKDVQAIGIYL